MELAICSAIIQVMELAQMFLTEEVQVPVEAMVEQTLMEAVTLAQDQGLAHSSFIGEAGAYVSNVKDDGTQYICYISDANGTVVDAIAISYSGENLGKV